MRVLVIGDIHGALKALQQVLDRGNFDNSKDQLIILGDYSDGWSETSELVEFLINLQEESNNRHIFIRGNHDVWTYDWLNTGESPQIWRSQGGEATVESYIKTGFLPDKRHLEFFKNLKDWYIDEENRLFIHGGWAYLDHRVSWPADLTPIQKFELQAALPMRGGGSLAKECHWDRDILSGARSGSVGKNGRFKALEIFKEIYIGHTAQVADRPPNYLNLWNMDTGAGWNGKLSMMDVNSKEYWQSDLSKELYPNDRGRM